MEAKQTDPRPIAYANGTSGGVFHTSCWYDYADEYYEHRHARAFLGTVYYPGAEKRELKGLTCKRCGQPFGKASHD